MERMIARWTLRPLSMYSLSGPRRWMLIAGLLSMVILACSGAGGQPTAAALETAAPTATPTVSPTPTPSPVIAETPSRGSQSVAINLPDDEGAHLSPIEWWYFNGHLTDDSGVDYSFHYVVFQSLLPSGLTPRLAHLGWADHGKGIYMTAEQPDTPQAKASTGGFDFTLSTWRMSGNGEEYDLAFDVGEYALELQAASRKPPVLHQGTGLVDLGRAGETYYYSRTRLDVAGTLRERREGGGEERTVSGIAWMDHQWGEFSTAPLGWDWLSLQFDDDSELTVSLAWDSSDHSPIINYGTYVPPDAQWVHLNHDDISWTPTGSWTSPATGAEYPMGWELRVKPLALEIELIALQEDSEFRGSEFVLPAYWEGAVTGKGIKNGKPIGAKGFVEMVGYDPREFEYPTPPARSNP